MTDESKILARRVREMELAKMLYGKWIADFSGYIVHPADGTRFVGAEVFGIVWHMLKVMELEATAKARTAALLKSGKACNPEEGGTHKGRPYNASELLKEDGS